MKSFRDHWFDNPYLVAIIVCIVYTLTIVAMFVALGRVLPLGSV